MFYIPGNRLLQIVLAFLLFISVPAFGLTMHEFTDEDVTFEWTGQDERTQWFEVRLRWIDLDVTPTLITESTRIEKDIVTATLKRPRLGHWAVEVRACALFKQSCVDGKITDVADPTGSLQKCSDWIKSNINGSPEPWAVYWKPKPVTDITINDYTP